jgi:hypothetical protein
MPRLRRDHDEADEAEPHSGFQGEGGACGAEGGEDAGGVGVVLRCSPEPDTTWKAQLLEGASGVFGPGWSASEVAQAVDVKTLHAKIGELTLENDFLAGALTKAGMLSAKR